MAGETQEASTGYNGGIKIDGYELVGVQGFGLPQNKRARVPADTLKNLRPKTIKGRYENSQFTVTLLYRPQSTTDLTCHELNESGEQKAIELEIPQADGTIVEKWAFDGEVVDYSPNELDADAAMVSVLTIEVQSDIVRTPV